MIDIAAVTAGHAGVLAELDPLLPEPPALAGEPDELLTARYGDSVAVGQMRTDVLAPEAESALWSPLRAHRLTVRSAGPDRCAALDPLLARWDVLLSERADPGDRDSAAFVTLASRDVEPVRALVLHGFAPLVVVAARRSGGLRSAAPGVRPAERADVEALGRLAAELHHADTRFGVVTEQPGAQALLRDAVAAQLAEVDGQIVGFAQVQPPAQAGWVAPLTAVGPAAYFGYLYVSPGCRAAGLGTVPVTLLHHALASPHSTPFWARQGYRPLWTSWQRRPAVG